MEFEQLAEALKALGETTRLKIVALLTIRDCCVCELVPLFGISQPAISKHLGRLKTTGLVKETRKGQWVFYSLNRERLSELSISLNHLPDLSHELKTLEEQGHLVCSD